jgi:hypothetical protein
MSAPKINHQGEFTQGVGGWAEYTVYLTKTDDMVRHEVTVPPGKVIPVIFLPGVMGSNLRMTKVRQDRLERKDNRAWRPDDMTTTKGQIDVVMGSGIGNWFKNATPAQRQLVFDQNETEVEYYHYTESEGRFDPEGKETRAADARHQNVPNDMPAIPPLVGTRNYFGKPQAASPAQIARWRGWSEVLFGGAYSELLKTAELFLNNIAIKGKVGPLWQKTPIDSKGKPILAPFRRNISQLLMGNPSDFGAASGSAICEDELLRISTCWYPVHALGYNFLKSNGTSAEIIANRIRGIARGYRRRGFKCEEVIIVTHSMGGLLARALIHPDYGNLLNDSEVKILGIYHGAMPTLGAACAYKRMRFGFQESDSIVGEIQAKVLGIDGQHATAILANAPAALELMPGTAYGPNWLKVVDKFDRVIASWPRAGDSPLSSIYLQSTKYWWRLINPLWVNPARLRSEDGAGMENVEKRLSASSDFVESIAATFHPKTYFSYCESKKRASYGEVVFKIISVSGITSKNGDQLDLPPPESWVLISDDAKGALTIRAGDKILRLRLESAAFSGDETVPADRSARRARGQRFVHGEKGDGYEHQNSYSDPQVLASMLYSIVQIAKTAKWS